ncbi:DUF21 domain-containing protein [bacterium]|nr:DUF21 domain-containing protein [bacterium]
MIVTLFIAVGLFTSTAHAAVGGGGGEVSGDATGEDIVLLVVYVLLALLVSFLCSIAEAVLLSVTPSYIERQMEVRPGRGRLLKKLKQENVDRSLAAILTLNTIAHTVGAIGAGAKATIVFGSAWFGLFSAVMTLLILFLSEIIPKTLGAVHWTRLTGVVAQFVRLLILVLYPLVWISERLTRLVSHGGHPNVFSRDEFLAMARIGEQTGQLHGDESRVIRNLFHFRRLKTTDIMTPRTVMVALPESITVGDAAGRLAEIPFSRLPVFAEDIDHITGFVLKDDILYEKAEDRADTLLSQLRRPLHIVPESIALPTLFDSLLTQRRHIALVVDEHGGTSGLVTLEDLIETLTGREIMDETDVVMDMRDLAMKRRRRRLSRLGKRADRER